MTLVHSVMVSFQRPYDVIRVAPFFVIRVADTGSLYNSIIRVAPFLSSQCLFLCHPSAQTLGSHFTL
ncbi:hypothetical protein [Wolbachia endosymbiont (group A) of Pogonocherus hispidulus]|uniref:hypothetical protein n=1 Tax=Wolbachia endosymbiont (group A) of Pogonocherus hispidulus TaxID=3066136 RepID=UPI00333ECCEC